MFAFTDYLYPIIAISLLIAIYDLIYPYFKHKISKSNLFSYIIIAIVSATAIYYTQAKTILLPVFFINLYLVYSSKASEKQYTKIPYALMFLGAAGLLCLCQYLYVYFHPDVMLIANQDHYFYVNKAQQMAKLGVESVVAHSPNDAPTQYHFFDLWLLKPLSLFGSNPHIIYLILYMPLGFTLLYSHLLDLIAALKKTKLNYTDCIALFFVPFICPLVKYAPDIFTVIDPAITAVYSYSKTFILLWFMLILFKQYFFEKNPFRLMVTAVLIALAFITILPAMALFVIVYYIHSLYHKRIGILSRQHIAFLIANVLMIIYIYSLYLQPTGSQSPSIIQQTNSTWGYKMKFLFQCICLIILYSPYLFPVFFYKISTIKENFKRFGQLYFIPLGGLVAFLFLGDKIPNANQFYALSLLVFFTAACPMIWYYQPFSRRHKIIFFILLFLAYVMCRNRPVMLKVDKTDALSAQKFTQKNKISSNIAFVMPEKWKPDALVNLEDFFAPTDVLLDQALPIDAFWLELYKGGVPKEDKFYEYSLNLLNHTVFAKFCKQNPQSTAIDNQLPFIKAKNIKTLIVGNSQALSPQVKALIIDSAQIKHKNLPNMMDASFMIYQLK